MKTLRKFIVILAVTFSLSATVVPIAGDALAPNDSSLVLQVSAKSKYHNGKTYMKKRNWYSDWLYVSKHDLHSAGAGLSVGGAWLSDWMLSGIAATMGYKLSTMPGGVILIYNRLMVGFGGELSFYGWQ